MSLRSRGAEGTLQRRQLLLTAADPLLYLPGILNQPGFGTDEGAVAVQLVTAEVALQTAIHQEAPSSHPLLQLPRLRQLRG